MLSRTVLDEFQLLCMLLYLRVLNPCLGSSGLLVYCLLQRLLDPICPYSTHTNNTNGYMQLKAAKQHLSRMATTSGQQRFEPADLEAFLASLPDTCTDNAPEDEEDPTPRGVGINLSDGSDAEHGAGDGVRLRHMGDISFVPEERRGGMRQKGLSKGLRAGLKGKQRRVSPGQTCFCIRYCCLPSITLSLC